MQDNTKEMEREKKREKERVKRQQEEGYVEQANLPTNDCSADAQVNHIYTAYRALCSKEAQTWGRSKMIVEQGNKEESREVTKEERKGTK